MLLLKRIHKLAPLNEPNTEDYIFSISLNNQRNAASGSRIYYSLRE